MRECAALSSTALEKDFYTECVCIEGWRSPAEALQTGYALQYFGARRVNPSAAHGAPSALAMCNVLEIQEWSPISLVVNEAPTRRELLQPFRVPMSPLQSRVACALSCGAFSCVREEMLPGS